MSGHHASPGGQPPASTGGDGASPAVDETMTLRAVGPGAGRVLPTPLGPAATRPSATDLDLFDRTQPIARVPDVAAPESPDEVPPGRRRRGVLFAVAGAVVLVVGAAGWASGVFSYETPSRNDSAPEEVREGVPDPSSEAPSAEPTGGASDIAPTASASPSGSPSTSASPSATAPSPTASSALPTASDRAAEPSPTGPASSAPVEAPGYEDGGDDGDDTPPVLRRGDRGGEVVELQQRLKRVFLYHDELHGQFNRRVEEAVRTYQWTRGIREEMGVYGPQTRARLEAETPEL